MRKAILILRRLVHKINPFYFLSIALFFVLGFILRFWDLNRQSLWQDEIHTAIYVNDHPSLWQIVHRVATWDLHSPLYYLLLRIQVWIEQAFSIPLTDGNLRIVSAVLGSITLPVIFILLRKIEKRKWYALAGLCFASINIYGIYFSQELRMYSLLMLMAALVLYFQMDLWDKINGQLNWFKACGYVLSNVLMLYSSLVGLFFVLGVWLSIFIINIFEIRKYPDRWKQTLLMGLIILICYTPWLEVMWRQSQVLKHGVKTGSVFINPRELFKSAFEQLYFFSWKIDGFLGVFNKVLRLLMPLVLLNLLDKERKHAHGKILLAFFLSFAIYFIVTFKLDFQTARYFAPWWPFAIYFLIATLSGAEVLLSKTKLATHWIILLFVVLASGYIEVQYTQIRYYFTRYQKENWRDAVRFLEEHKQPGDALVVTGDWERINLTYYGATLPFIILTDLIKNTPPLQYQRLIYLGVDNPKIIEKKITIDFKEIKWPVECKPFYLWERQ